MAIWDNKQSNQWPPKAWEANYELYEELAVWYSGDPNRLLKFYEEKVNPHKIDYYWGMAWEEETREAIHLPVAGDIAQMSANLLFGEELDIQYDTKQTKVAERITNFMNDNGLTNLLLEGSEMAAAFGGLFLKLDYDAALSEYPLLTVRTPLNAFPEFRSGRLVAVTFHRSVGADSSGSIWRLFEDRRLVNGNLNITYKLYKGTDSHLGREVGLESVSEVAEMDLKDEVIGIPALGVVYVPNMRPNKLVPGSPLGEADYRACIGFMDALDFTWSSWMRDIELGLAQLIIDEGLVADGKFSKLQRLMVKLNMEPIRLGSEKYEPITPIQFKIRTDDHMKTCDQLTRQIIGMSGYAPQTFGMTEYGQQRDSGTALRIRERKSLLTRTKKSGYWIPEINRLFTQMQLFDGYKKGAKYEPLPVNVVLQDSVVQDITELSEVVRNLEQAQSASILTRVSLLHPGWTEEEILAEVGRIQNESSIDLVDNNPFEGLS